MIFVSQQIVDSCKTQRIEVVRVVRVVKILSRVPATFEISQALTS